MPNSYFPPIIYFSIGGVLCKKRHFLMLVFFASASIVLNSLFNKLSLKHLKLRMLQVPDNVGRQSHISYLIFSKCLLFKNVAHCGPFSVSVFVFFYKSIFWKYMIYRFAVLIMTMLFSHQKNKNYFFSGRKKFWDWH